MYHNFSQGKPGKYFDEITKDIQCEPLFSNSKIDQPTQFQEAPQRIPKWLHEDFTYQGKVELKSDYRDQSNSEINNHTNFTMFVIDAITAMFDKGKLTGNN